jgi:hypothetical protein
MGRLRARNASSSLSKVRLSRSPSLIMRDGASNRALSSRLFSLSFLMAIKGPLPYKRSSTSDPGTTDPTVVFLFFVAVNFCWFEAPFVRFTASLVEGFRDSAAFNTLEVKVELVWCAIMSSIQLSAESHLFWYVIVDSSAVVRRFFTISALDGVTDAKSCVCGYNLLPNGIIEWNRLSDA